MRVSPKALQALLAVSGLVLVLIRVLPFFFFFFLNVVAGQHRF